MSKRFVLVSMLVCAALGSPPLLAAPTRFLAHIDGEQVGGPTSPSRCDTDVGPGLVLIELEGSGHVNRIGAVTVEASHCVIDDPAEPAIEGGEMTLHAEGGDLMLSYSGTDDAGDLNGDFTIIGGTGDFAGATGGGTFSGLVEPGNRGDLQLRGRINLP